MEVIRVRHAWPEKKGFKLVRANNGNDFIFIHFWQPVKLGIGNVVYDTEPNAVVILNKDTANSIESSLCDLVHDYIHIQGDVIDKLLEYGLSVDTVYYPQNCGFITDIVRKIEGEKFGNEKFSSIVTDKYLDILFALISRHIESRQDLFVVDYKTESDFKNLRTKIFSDLENGWNIRQMAEFVNMSESRFYVLYKTIFKTTPNQDLIMAKVDYAKQLLSQNVNIQIAEVAQKCGYVNEFHFIRIFKKNVGVTPKQYAMIHRNNSAEPKQKPLE